MTISVEGSITITINSKPFTLTGTVGKYIVVEYHEPFATAIDVGTLPGLATEIGTALGATQIGEDLTSALNSLDSADLPALKAVVTLFKTAHLKITDLVVNTLTHTYEVGVAFDFSAAPPKVGNLALESFGVKVTYTGS